jgi:hypothetical protein
MRYLIYDIETRSQLRLKEFGAYRYSRHPSTDIWCVSYCLVVDGVRGEIKTWLPGDPVPAEFLAAAADPETLIIAFNDGFERVIEAHILGLRYGWPILPIERRRCAQAISLSFALPASLDAVAEALGLKVRKTAEGKRAMKLLAAPRKPRKGEDPAQIYWRDTPERLATLYEYNRVDVGITADIIERLGFIPTHEQDIWTLDAAINARGIHIDTSLLDPAIAITEQSAVELDRKLIALTDGVITGPAQTQRILKWLGQHGCTVPNVQEETLELALERGDLQPEARQLIEYRLNGAQAAVKKLATLRRWMSPTDGRIRQVFRYHGAMPGRFTSVGVQAQNLRKPDIDGIEVAIAAVRTGNLRELQARYERPLDIVGGLTRAMVTPAPGHRFFIADLSGIESRGLAWIAGEISKLDAWRRFDETGDPEDEPYRKLAKEFGITGDDARGKGKTCLGPDTLVLTDRGVKPITSVQIGDKLWDGVSWVNHRGLMNQGLRHTIQRFNSVWLTPDHLILCGNSWLTADELSIESAQTQALATGSANLPLPAICSARAVDCRPSWLNAFAALLNTLCCWSIWPKVDPLNAGLALSANADRNGKNIGVTLISALKTLIGADCLIGFQPFKLDASRKTLGTLAIGDMRAAALASIPHGAMGQRDGEPSSSMCLHFLGGMTRSLCSIGSTTTTSTNPETSASRQRPPATTTSPPSTVATRLSPTYDLACAGPRSRFTVVTAAGPIIVHNCDLAFQYQGGIGAWRRLAGTDDDTPDDTVKRYQFAWRQRHPKITQFWDRSISSAVKALDNPRVRFPVAHIAFLRDGNFLHLELPCGRTIKYPQARVYPTEFDDRSFTFKDASGGRWEWLHELKGKPAFGGLVAENCTQALCRDIFVDAMLRLDAAGYRLVLHLHDEFVCEVPDDFGNLDEFKRIIAQPPTWAPDFPVATKARIADRFIEIKKPNGAGN